MPRHNWKVTISVSFEYVLICISRFVLGHLFDVELEIPNADLDERAVAESQAPICGWLELSAKYLGSS